MPPRQARAESGALEQALGYRFADRALLDLALTHRSASPSRNNERLEFLGDALLGHVIAEQLYYRFPTASEGQLTRARVRLVRSETLTELAREFSLGNHLRLGGGELRSGGFRRDSILADAMEALIAAVHLDGGFVACRDRVQAWFASRLDALALDAVSKDPKTALQEWLQARALALPVYEVLETAGEAHALRFHVACRAGEPQVMAKAWGDSRRGAEQESARLVLAQLENPGG